MEQQTTNQNSNLEWLNSKTNLTLGEIYMACEERINNLAKERGGDPVFWYMYGTDILGELLKSISDAREPQTDMDYMKCEIVKLEEEPIRDAVIIKKPGDNLLQPWYGRYGTIGIKLTKETREKLLDAGGIYFLIDFLNR